MINGRTVAYCYPFQMEKAEQQKPTICKILNQSDIYADLIDVSYRDIANHNIILKKSFFFLI